MINFTEQENELEDQSSSWEDIYPLIAAIVYGLDVSASVLSIFGCLGNIFVMMIISKWENISSGAACMFSLALGDFLAVAYDGIIDQGLLLFGFAISNVNSFVCAVSIFFNYTTSVSSYYLTALFGLDKCIAVMFPFVYRNYGKPKVCIGATVLIYMLVGLYFSYTLFVFRLDPTVGVCKPYNFAVFGATFIFDVNPEIVFWVIAIIPITLVFSFTGVTIYGLRRNTAATKKPNDQNQDKSKKKPTAAERLNYEITRQMIVVCVMFGLLNIASSIQVRLNWSTNIQTNYDEAIVTLRDRILSVINILINSVNFYIYVIFGKKFRANFFELFGKTAHQAGATTTSYAR